jgi:rRNA biogenesis protein RRP5
MSSLEGVFTRAVQESKGKYIYLALADTYELADDIDGAAGVLEKALKRHKKSKKVWMRYHELYIKHGMEKKAKECLSRSIQSLSRHKHIEVISHYALTEFEHGSIDRGRVLFEDLLTSYPKRTDLWHIYIDKEVKAGYIPQARQLLDRLVSGKLSAHNMKAAFKKYLQLESKYGTPSDEERVKDMAKDYVARLTSA